MLDWPCLIGFDSDFDGVVDDPLYRHHYLHGFFLLLGLLAKNGDWNWIIRCDKGEERELETALAFAELAATTSR